MESTKKRVDRLEEDDKLKKQVEAMLGCGDFGPADRTGKGYGPWSDAVLKANSGPYGFKTLLTSGTVAVPVPLDVDPIRDGEPARFLRQLIPSSPSDGGRFAYLRQTARTNNADVVAEGTTKPTSVYTLERVEDYARTIAHLSEAIPRQQIDDAAMLREFVDREMRLGLNMALDAQIVTGDGTGENMTGLANVSGSQSQAWDTDLLVTTRKAITKLEVVDLMPTGWLFNPADWESLELSAESTGAFLMAGPGTALPVDRAARRLWGIPVVVNTAVPSGVGYLADFDGSTHLWVREEARLDWSENVGSDFSDNMVRFRCEGRFGFAVLRPLGVVEVDLTAA